MKINIECTLMCPSLFFSRAIEACLRRNPQHVNFRRPLDGHVALHIAAANNRFDVASFLAQMVCCQSTPTGLFHIQSIVDSSPQ